MNAALAATHTVAARAIPISPVFSEPVEEPLAVVVTSDMIDLQTVLDNY